MIITRPEIGFPEEWFEQLKTTGVYSRHSQPGATISFGKIGTEVEIYNRSDCYNKERLIGRIENCSEHSEGFTTTWVLIGTISYL